MKIPWPWHRDTQEAAVDRDEELHRAQKELEFTQSQTPIHRAIVQAAAREVFHVNNLAKTFRETLRKGQP